MTPPDLTACDREPIHAPGAVQPHGVLLAVGGPDHRVTRASANAAGLFGRPLDAVLGRPLADLFAPADAALLLAGLASPALAESPLYLGTVAAGGRPAVAVGHRHAGATLVELEPAPTADPVTFRDLYPLVRSFVGELPAADGLEAVCRRAAAEVRRMTGFDRALVYRFTPDWHGYVVAESKVDDLPPYLGLHFPASDIPAPARVLYRVNRLRLIPDAGYAPVPVVPELDPDTGRPLDLSYSALRGVAPVHREYLRNMGVAASLSVSVLRDGELWALIACHHRTPKTVPLEVRTALDLLAQMLSAQTAAHELAADNRHRIELRRVQAKLLAAMAAEGDVSRGLAARADDWLAFAGAAGAAVVLDGACVRVGAAPPEPAVRALAERVAAAAPGEEVFSTDNISAALPDLPGVGELVGPAAGVLAVSVSKLHPGYVFWFRPEVVRTVTWGGDPRTPAAPAGDGRLHPRASFAAWREEVRGRAEPWRPAELAAAADLRNDIVGIVLRRAEERAQLAAELESSNKELRAFSYSVSHDLRAPFRHISGYAEMLRDRAGDALDPTAKRYVATIAESARFAGRLVDGLLDFTRMGQTALRPARVDLAAVAADARGQIGPGAVAWAVGPLPVVHGDPTLLRVVFQNLFENAVKFSRGRPAPRVEVTATRGDAEVVVCVRDNGVGFDPRYADKLFGVFQRLHRAEEFEGTGIGLANVRRVVERHGGRVWAEGAPGHGAAFFFALPDPAAPPAGRPL